MLKLLQFGTVMVFVDSRQRDVVVPEHLKEDYQLRLNFDYAYEVDDFRVLPDRLEASLSFNRRNFFCVIPFNAVYLMVSHAIQHGVLFTRSVPVEMLEYLSHEATRQQALEKRKAAPFTVISNKKPVEKTRKAVPATPAEAKEVKPVRKAHLRLVK